MFGKNIPIKPVYQGGVTLRVISIFKTIQGEGPLAGMPAIFIRLAGCNLRCFFCDTEFTEGAREQGIEYILEQVQLLANKGISLVVLTGGEPLAQPVLPLIELLALNFFHVQIETAGTVWQGGLSEPVIRGEVTIVCSPKTPSVHPQVARFCENWKYIIREGEQSPVDGLPIYSTQERDRESRLFRPSRDYTHTIWVQPCDEHEEDRTGPKIRANISACVETCQRFGYRLSFQVHKVIGVE